MFDEVWVWRSGALGDFIATLPVIHALRSRARRLVLVAPSRYRALWDGADAWLDPDSAKAGGIFAGSADLTAVDLAVTWTFSAAEALRGCGVRSVAEGTPHPTPGVAIHDHLWQPIAAVAGRRIAVPELTPEPSRVARILERLGGASPVVIAPGSGGARKRWPIESWRVVADAVAPLPALWIGGPLEADEPGWGAPRWNDLGIADLTALAKCCRVWVGPDSGPGHLAAAVGARVGVWFNGRTDPAQWAPPGARVFLSDATPAEIAAWIRSDAL